MGLFLCILLVCLLVGALPFWSHTRSWEWGYLPSSLCGLLLVGLGALLNFDYIPWR